MAHGYPRSWYGLAAITCLALAAPAIGANASPTIVELPAVDASTVLADDSTEYTVSMTVSDGNGYNDIRELRILFNYTESAGDYTLGRGYLAWGAADSDITRYSGTWTLADATGSGRWGYQTDPWDAGAYITPVACATTTTGTASGGVGQRTVTWTFKAKPAWAGNPVINDVDGYTADYTVNLGWKDGGTEFDVVANPCGMITATPHAPVIGQTTADSLDVAIDPRDSASDLFAIRIVPAIDDQAYLQPDGSLGGLPAWQSRAAWGTVILAGLRSGTSYTLTVRAMDPTPGYCPSPWGPAAIGTTATLNRTITWTAGGTAIHPGVDGMDSQAKNVREQLITDTIAASFNTSMRFGGDGYNWKTRTAQWNSSTRSTLQALREARDQNSYIQMCLNTRGIGTGNGSTWVYTDQTPQTLGILAADWVYYCNVLVPNKRQGDVLTTYEQQLLAALDWGTDDKLLAPGEPATPPVVYWEIGNEPEGPYPPPALSPTDYATRYKTIVNAMIAKDSTVQVGPCVMSADNGNAWLDAVFANTSNRVNFVAYHPYGPLYNITHYNAGGLLDADLLMDGLDSLKDQQIERKAKVVERLVAYNRPADAPLIASEWNPSSWQGTYYYGLARTVAQGLGIAESIFTFAELDMPAAQYWDFPNHPSTSAIEIPCFKVFKAMQEYFDGRLIDSYSETYFRLYTTFDPQANRLVVWGINFSDTEDKPVHLQLDRLGLIEAITERKLAAVDGDTSVILQNNSTDMADKVDWLVTDRTGQIDPEDFTITFEDATLTLLIFDLAPMAPVDFDRDGDVDQDDFGHFQACLTGSQVTQDNPGCENARLDGDEDVDAGDLTRFLNCMTGPETPVDPSCSQ